MFKHFLIKHNIIKGRFWIEAFIYCDENGNVNDEGKNIKFLEPFFITCKHKDMDELAFMMLNYKYPEYKGHIGIY